MANIAATEYKPKTKHAVSLKPHRGGEFADHWGKDSPSAQFASSPLALVHPLLGEYVYRRGSWVGEAFSL